MAVEAKNGITVEASGWQLKGHALVIKNKAILYSGPITRLDTTRGRLKGSLLILHPDDMASLEDFIAKEAQEPLVN